MHYASRLVNHFDASIKLVQFKMSYPSKKYKIQEEELIMPRNTKQHSKQFKLEPSPIVKNIRILHRLSVQKISV